MRLKKVLLYFITIVILFINPINCLTKDISKTYIIKLKNSHSFDNFLSAGNIPESSISSLFEKEISSLQKNNRAQILSQTQSFYFNRLKEYYIISLDSLDEPDFINKLRANPIIESIEENFKYNVDILKEPNDPLYNQQWALSAVNALKAWQKATGKSVRIGVIDTGIDFEHPDLIEQLWINSGEDINKNGRFEPWQNTIMNSNGIFGDLNGIDDDGNGYVDDVIGYDFVDQLVKNIGDDSNRDAIPFDENGHGTFISGIISAKNNNNIGISGLAYDSKLVSLRAFDASGGGENDDIAAAIVYAALNGIRILNFSFGDTKDSPLLRDVVNFAHSMGCFMAASSGNNGSYMRHYPSSYNEVLSVGSSTEKNIRDVSSNYGAQIGLLAPGRFVITTEPGNKYKLVSGTSIATPHVSAVAAMLLEADSTLTPDDINGIIKVSAQDIGDIGWDIYTGTGILDANNALESIGRTNVKIDFPKNEEEFNKSRTRKISVIGSTVTPLFKNFQVLIGKGLNPNEWIPLMDTVNVQIKNDTLVTFDISTFADSIYTIRLQINLKNFNSIVKMIHILITSDSSKFEISSFNIIYPYSNGRRIVAVNALTNRKARLNLYYKPENSAEEFKKISEVENFEQFHNILIEELVNEDLKVNGIIEAYSFGADTVRKNINFKIPSEAMPIDKFNVKSYKLPPSYLCNNIIDFYADGKEVVAINDLSGGDWGKANLYEFNNGQFIKKDTSNSIILPVGTGDSNGDGINEVLTLESGSMRLYQGSSKFSNPFSNIIFADSTSRSAWAAQMYDFNNDGKPEIIVSNDTAFVIYSYINSQYQQIGITTHSASYKKLGTTPGLALGDFDGNGSIDICHSNDRGHIFIHRNLNGGFLTVIDSTNLGNSFQYLFKIDIDGDGIDEILSGTYINMPLPNVYDSKPFWSFRILKYENEIIKTIWQEFVNGVRINSVRNGISAGNIDGEPGDEIILLPFPNTYIFKWDKQNQAMKPLWWWNQTFSNSAVVFDFDKNGINEVGISTGFDTRFFEYKKDFNAPDLPTGFDGWALDDSSAYLFWNKSKNAEEYEIYYLVNDTLAEYLSSTNQANIILSNLKDKTNYRFVLRSVNNLLTDKYSHWSDIVYAYTHTPIEIKSVIYSDDHKSLKISFTGKIPESVPDGSRFILQQLDIKKTYIPSTVLSSGDSAIILNYFVILDKGKYKITSLPFADFYRTPSKESNIEFELKYKDVAEEIYLKRLNVLSLDKLELQFSEPVDFSTASLSENYVIKPNGKVRIVEQTSESETIRLMLDKDVSIGARGKNYTLTAYNILSQTKKPITKGAGNTLGFIFVADNINDAYVYPNPVIMSKVETIYFANLPARAQIQILTTDGELLKTLSEIDGNGGTPWDGTDNKGNKLGSGIYLFRVLELHPDGTSSESELIKFTIIN